jgi:hypothetical protein
MAQTTRKAFDERLLTHHPAGQACVEVCLSHGWQPNSADVIRLVKLWDQVRQGQRSEVALSQTRLEYARWLYVNGKINEGHAGAESAPSGE